MEMSRKPLPCHHGYNPRTCNVCKAEAVRTTIEFERDKWQNRAHEINGFLATARSDLALMTAERDKLRAELDRWERRPGMREPNIGPNATVEARLTRLERLVSKL
jgi:hypothetical protein